MANKKNKRPKSVYINNSGGNMLYFIFWVTVIAFFILAIIHITKHLYDGE